MTLSSMGERGLDDFVYFCREILGMPIKDQPHVEMASFLCDDTQPNKLMLVPRDCWKTSLGTTAFPLWKVLRAYFIDGNPSYRCLIDSSTVRLSQFVLEAIGSYSRDSETLKACYGNLYDRKLQRENWLSLAFRKEAGGGGIREPHFLASGVNAAKTGLHFDLVVLDDLVTKENVNSVAQRQKVYDHYRMMYGILEADATGQKTFLHLTGTRYHDDDLYGRILAHEEKRVAEGHPPAFAIMLRAAVNDGELFYPDVLNEDELARRKAAMGGLFWAQYMNDPNKETAPFKREALKFIPLSEVPPLQMVRLTIDAAIKDEAVAHGDYNAAVVAGWDRWRNPYILDVSLRRDMPVGTMIETSLDMAEKWKVEQIIIEDRSGELLFALFQQEMVRRGKHFPIHMVKTGNLAGKETRWARLQPFADRAGFHIANEIPEVEKLELVDEWTRAPFARYDDFMDALELQLTFLAVDSEGEGERPALPERSPLDILDGKPTPSPARTLKGIFPHLAMLPEEGKEAPEADEFEIPTEEEEIAAWQ